jgi:hypothetical protein
LAEAHRQGERRPVQVELISRSRRNLPPGADGPLPAWEESTLYTLDLRADSGR